MFNKKNNKEEVIRMEQTTFIQRHYKKVIFAGSVLAGVYITHLLKKHNIEVDDLLKKHDMDILDHEMRLSNVENKLMVNTEIAVSTLKDAIRRYEFEISELVFKRDNLDQSATQNIFMNIPKINEEIELKTNLMERAMALLDKAIENGKTE